MFQKQSILGLDIRPKTRLDKKFSVCLAETSKPVKRKL